MEEKKNTRQMIVHNFWFPFFTFIKMALLFLLIDLIKVNVNELIK